MIEQLQSLMKALEAGSYNAAPSQLVQGSALQVEDLSPVMQNVTFEDKHLKLQKMLSIKDAKSTLIQFNRQLSYGGFGSSAQYEGGVGEENTSDYVRAVVPMAYYSNTRQVTVAANMVNTFDGVKAEDRSAQDAAMLIAADIEFDLFRGQADFSNNGVFDGNPLATADVPNMVGLDQQIRQSDYQANTQDLMFASYGSDQSVVLAANGNLSQTILEDAAVRSAMNHGSADKFVLDPITLSAYNKIAFAKERIMLAGSPQEASGANLRTQWTSSGAIALEPSRFLSGKTKPLRAKAQAPAAPSIATADAGAAQSLLDAGDYVYYVTAVNERGEGLPSAASTVTVAADGNAVNVTITAVSAAKYYEVYRSAAGGTAADAKFIGKIKQGVGNPVFKDLGNRSPGSVTGFLLDTSGFAIHQLAAYSKLDLAVSSLAIPRAHFRFLCVAAMQPRKSVLVDNLSGQLF